MLPIQRLKRSNTIDNLWIYILTLIKDASDAHPAYAYELRTMIENAFHFKCGQITAYRVLYRLEGDGFVISYQIERKRVYKITEKGLKELQAGKDFFRELTSKLG